MMPTGDQQGHQQDANSENEQALQLAWQDVAVAETFLRQGVTYDNLVDAAETLCRAANRIAPDGHAVQLTRQDRYGDRWTP